MYMYISLRTTAQGFVRSPVAGKNMTFSPRTKSLNVSGGTSRNVWEMRLDRSS